MLRLTEFVEVRHNCDITHDPSELKPGVLYICEDVIVQYLCPCGCGKIVHIPYYTGEKKDGYGWKYSDCDGKITLSPSILSCMFECKSHYFIRDNKVAWC